MPKPSLRRKLLQELDDFDLTYKRARLSSYLDDIRSLTPTSEGANTSSTSIPLSGISSASTPPSCSSGSGSDSPISSTASEIMEDYYLEIEKEIQRFREKITNARVLSPKPKVAKHSQIHLLSTWRNGNLDQFRWKVRVDPSTFDGILEKIRDHHIFHNNSHCPQIPVETQLAIFMYHAGHYGNAASPEAIGHWAGVCPGTVVNSTNRVMVALLTLHDELIHLPTPEEKKGAKEWVAEKVCPEWMDGYFVVDGTKFVLFQRPGLHGDAWFDKNRNYSLDCQVCSLPISWVYLV